LLLPLVAGACSLSDPAPTETTATHAETQLSINGTLAQLSEFSFLRQALNATDREALLQGNGPFTLLAPRDTALAQLPADQRDALLAPQNREALGRALDQLIVPTPLRAQELRRMIADGGGTATVASRAGQLTFSLSGDDIVVTTSSGAKATMGTQETSASNGMLYVIDHWLGPASAGAVPPAASAVTPATSL
jgi:uncharacterized surface protein with fasciclin (FAS1) repeats